LAALDQQQYAVDKLTQSTWFLTTEPQRIPVAFDFLPAQAVEAIEAERRVKLQPRKYDEKFHMLQAPELFLNDLAYYRNRADMRGTTTSIAFLDIDNFKQLNRNHTETKVDRNLLPRFMMILEASLDQHGFAYRQRGDEYLVLIPSLSPRLALEFLDDVRVKIAEASYPQIQEKTRCQLAWLPPDRLAF
jgi:diguanylate cyclase (GGDEF)-like protein